MLTAEQLADLRRIANEADADGREWTWKASERAGMGGYPQQVLRVGDVVLVCTCYDEPDQPAQFADFIAAFDPPTVLELLRGYGQRAVLTPFQREVLEAVAAGLVRWHPAGHHYTGLARRGFSATMRTLEERRLVQRAATMGDFRPVQVDVTDEGQRALQ